MNEWGKIWAGENVKYHVCLPQAHIHVQSSFTKNRPRLFQREQKALKPAGILEKRFNINTSLESSIQKFMMTQEN